MILEDGRTRQEMWRDGLALLGMFAIGAIIILLTVYGGWMLVSRGDRIATLSALETKASTWEARAKELDHYITAKENWCGEEEGP